MDDRINLSCIASPDNELASHGITDGSDRPPLVLTEVLGRRLVQIAGEPSAFDGLTLPDRPNTCTSDMRRVVAWIAPRRWLLIADRAELGQWSALDRAGMTVVDLSHSRMIARLSGDAWPDALSHGCPLDIARSFPQGEWRSAGSLFCEIPVLILVPPKRSWVELYAPRSYGDYLWDMLKLSAARQTLRLERTVTALNA